MLFRTAAAIAILASGAVAGRAPYMPVQGLSLARRSTNGYQPEQSTCKEGNSCSEACGSQYQDCASNDSDDHCYNPSIGQTCCADGSGNSCDKGYYCTHDTKANTMCCPDSMSLSECAAAYSVTGTLATNALLTTSTTSTSTSATPTSTSTTAFTSTTSSSTTSVKSTYSTPLVESTTPVYTTESVKTTAAANSTTPYATSAVYTTPAGSNSTYAAPSHTAGSSSSSGSGSGSGSGSTTASAPASTGAATATSMSALLLAAAGLFALF